MDKKPDSPDSSARKTAARKQPRKITPRYLENAALYYLQRYATSAENFRRVMTRKIDRSCAFHQTPPDEFYTFLDALTKRYIAAGLLNDKGFAEAKVSSLRRQGRSRRDILARLQAKGLKAADIETALAALEADSGTEADGAELAAAVKLARKKKLGIYNPRPPQDPKDRQKELAAMARAGFSYDIIRRALQSDGDIDVAEDDF